MEITVIAYCPECNRQNLVGLVQTGLLNEMSFYDDAPKNTNHEIFVGTRYLPRDSSVVTTCDCEKDFVVDVELQAHITVRKVVKVT